MATRNQARLAFGDDPVQGGDIFTVLLGNEVVPLDPKNGLPIYRGQTEVEPGVTGDPENVPPGTPRPGANEEEDDDDDDDEENRLTEDGRSIVIELDEDQFAEVFDVEDIRDPEEDLQDAIHAKRRKKKKRKRMGSS